MDPIQTRLLIISDTHGFNFKDDQPHPSADVAIHCGDLTDGSKLAEFHNAVKLLKGFDAPLKLAIAGNHDFTMDLTAFEKKVAEATPALDPELVAMEYGIPGEARQIFEEAKGAGITLLDEGSHCFRLGNGASLKVYASPYTPSMGAWGFQYRPDCAHQFSIEEGTDIAITHGPPKGIMDFTHGRERAGCPGLFAAVAQARPRIRCFGHIHEGWGAKYVTWRKKSGQLTHFSAIDNERSYVVEKLTTLKPSEFDDPTEAGRRFERIAKYEQDGYCTTSHCAKDTHPLEQGKQTLFVNASLCDNGTLTQKPWLVKVELPRAG